MGAAAQRARGDVSRDGTAAGLKTAAVLLLVRDPAGVERELGRLLPGHAALPLRREELRGLGPWGLVKRLRRLRADEVVVLTDDMDAHEALWRLLALGALPLAPHRELRDLGGRRLTLSAGRFLARDLPF